MKPEKVLEILRREMVAIGWAWRGNWGDFDGRTLRNQLNSLDDWAKKALLSETDITCQEGTDFLNGRMP